MEYLINKLINFSIRNPKKIVWMMLVLTAVCAAFVPMIRIDTDPENMLSEDDPVRVRHNALKEKFNLHDMLVVGVVNEEHPEGVFHQASLADIFELSQYAYKLGEPNECGEYEGVVQRDIMSPTNVDYIETLNAGQIRFDWVMPQAPQTEAEALAIRNTLLENELFYNTLVSADGKALALYLPLTAKDQSYRIAGKLKDKIATLRSSNRYYITGLPVAEDTFGIEMFMQMGISAPAAMLLIFVLMMYFFRKWRLVMSALIVAMVSVICTMGLLIGTGHTVHIMSSMIPIFILPIAVLDSVHILSEFHDRYRQIGDRKATLLQVMDELFKPMLFTSLTSAAGFASLALTPIPPVQVFGIFVSIGILLAWLLTMTFLPAYIMMTSEAALARFGQVRAAAQGGAIGRLLGFFQRVTFGRPRLVIGLLALCTAIAGYGTTRININDNPVKWFTPSHPIRVADERLNEHFGGSYMAYLSFSAESEEQAFSKAAVAKLLRAEYLGAYGPALLDSIDIYLEGFQADEGESAYRQLSDGLLDVAYDNGANDTLFEFYETISDWIAMLEIEEQQVFKRPEVLNYLLGLEDHVQREGGVGKSTSIAKTVRYINKKLHEDEPGYHRIPDDVRGVGQSLLSYQNSHIPEVLWHFVTPDYRSAGLWLQLQSGDNQDMEATMQAVEAYISSNPPPVALHKEWFGLTYINVVWQQKMVKGMMEAFLGSFVVVMLMMTVLFRSVKWAALCMIPLSLTILGLYGIIGWMGKDQDLPVAVLSSLALGLAVDFAIHFLVRARASLRENGGDWGATSRYLFGEPSRAIVRNVVVIAVGFLPLLLANLIPYRTLGFIMAAIMLLSGLVTLLLLPALIKIFNIQK